VTDTAPSPAAGWERRVESLEARVGHLESALEGLQDAVHRRSLLDDEQFEEMRRRTEPGQLARDISEDARRRGLE
jgi:uncharacterized coiled-coil protein SlyX